MKIKVLMENTALRPELACQPGLSLYIEAAGKKILFDAGLNADFASNAEKLGVDLSEVDLAILSHGHDDHGGGLGCFLERNATAPIYVSRHAFRPFFSGGVKDLALDERLKDSGRLVLVDSRLVEPAPGLTLFPACEVEERWPVEHFGLTTLSGGVHVDDDFRHEQYLLIREEKTVLISGCSHKGILNITHWARPDVLVGGFHFMKLDPQGEGAEKLEQAARTLMGYPTDYYTCHCTGLKQFAFLKSIMGERLRYLAVGAELDI